MYTFKAIYSDGTYFPIVLETETPNPRQISETYIKLERKSLLWFIKEYLMYKKER